MALLMTRLSQAEQLVLRDMYRWIPISEASFVDNQGQLYLPGGQEVTLRLVHSAGKAALLHTCLVASAAEIDFVLRAVAFYRANGSAMLDITPLIVTLSIGALVFHSVILAVLTEYSPPLALTAFFVLIRYYTRSVPSYCASHVSSRCQLQEGCGGVRHPRLDQRRQSSGRACEGATICRAVGVSHAQLDPRARQKKYKDGIWYTWKATRRQRRGWCNQVELGISHRCARLLRAKSQRRGFGNQRGPAYSGNDDTLDIRRQSKCGNSAGRIQARLG